MHLCAAVFGFLSCADNVTKLLASHALNALNVESATNSGSALQVGAAFVASKLYIPLSLFGSGRASIELFIAQFMFCIIGEVCEPIATAAFWNITTSLNDTVKVGNVASVA